jgi:multidrug efflux system membrane fusion protein
MVIEYQDFTGRTQAVQQVEIRARVTGYLVKVLFKDGAEVKKGDLLFEIDPRPYQAQLDEALRRVALDQASFDLARATYARDEALLKQEAGAISRWQIDQDRASLDEAKARIDKSRAAAEVSKLNLEFTKVVAPIDGRIGQHLLDPGNLVLADSTVLATVVSEDPIRAAFDIDEQTLLRLRRAMNEGKIKIGAETPVFIGLAGEADFPHRGIVDFMDNRVDPDKGTIRLRAIFPNPKPSGGVRLLSPGMSVRVRMPMGEPSRALLVRDRAIASEQGVKYVYVLDAENKVQHRRVETGPLQSDGLRVIWKGLKADDWVVVSDLQRLRSKMAVHPEKVTMPVSEASAESGGK